MILAIRTDAPSVTLALLDSTVNNAQIVIEAEEWRAERRLARELLTRIESLLTRHHVSWQDLAGLIVFKGPGSFTGLRIGITVMNTIAYSQSIAIIGSDGENWLHDGMTRLNRGDNDRIVMPEYGAPARITQPKK